MAFYADGGLSHFCFFKSKKRSLTKKIILTVLAIPLLYILVMLYFMQNPKWTDEYTSGRFEDFIIGEIKANLIARLKVSNHGFTPLPLNPDRDRNWVHLHDMTEKEYGFLLGSNKWQAGRSGYSVGCGSPRVFMYFDSNELSKIEVECWMSK